MKRCSKCDTFKPLDAFGKNRARPDGLNYWCKECRRIARAAFLAANRDYMHAKDAARYAADPAKFLERTKRYDERNAERVKAYRKQWRDANAERKKEQSAMHYRKNKERRRALDAEWMRRNPAYSALKSARRRARKLCATPAWASTEKIAEFYASAEGLRMLLGDWYVVDHIVPLQGRTVCGLHNEFNLQILTESENAAKSNRFWPDMP